MDSKVWDERYSISDYVYGVQPNSFFKNFIDKNKAGSVLLPAEGEGRNAVYAATKGWDVTAFDISKIAKDKALKLAHINNVSINYFVSDLKIFDSEKLDFDLVAIIFLHLPLHDRQIIFNKLFTKLKIDCYVLFEVFEKKQLLMNSGGPKVESMLYSKEDVESFVFNFSEKSVWEELIILNEGFLHNGKAHVVRAIAKK